MRPASTAAMTLSARGLVLTNPVLAPERPGVGVERAVEVEDVDELQPVPLARLEVLEAVPGRDFHRAGAELRIDQLRIGDDGELAPEDRMAHVLADHRLVARIVGVHRDGRVAQHRLRARGGDDDLPRAIGQWIGEFVQFALHALFVIDFQVGERRAVLHAPVDEALGPVEKPILVELHERLAHRARGLLVHGEALAVPVERSAQRAVLHGDAVAGLLLPRPDALQELLAAQVVARLAFFLQDLPLDHHLRGDAGMVDARHPADVEAAHALEAHHGVLDGGGERVAHVQRAGDVGRGQDDGEGRLLAHVL